MKKLLGVLGVVFSCFLFFQCNQENYEKHIIYKKQVVEHPESLPDSQTAKFTSIGYKNLVADLYWLQAIQYIGGNAIEAEYKKYLFVILDLITDLNPYFESPYIIGQLLLPDYNERYEEREPEEQQLHIRQGEILGLKGVENFCDPKKIELINSEENISLLWSEEKYRNPCKSYTIPYYLAYIYFFYLNEPLLASKYYKVTSAQEDAPAGARTLAAIMKGKAGEREKSVYMFLSLAESVETGNPLCTQLSQELQQIYLGLSSNQLTLDSDLVQAIENSRKSIFPDFSEDTEEEVLGDTKCTNYLNKAIREINLLYIAQANERFMQNHPENLPARNAKGLLEEGYIDFLPTDYQQYEEYGIIYAWDYERNRYDYEMGNY